MKNLAFVMKNRKKSSLRSVANAEAIHFRCHIKRSEISQNEVSLEKKRFFAFFQRLRMTGLWIATKIDFLAMTKTSKKIN